LKTSNKFPSHVFRMQVRKMIEMVETRELMEMKKIEKVKSKQCR
jgi:hypothetical protein